MGPENSTKPLSGSCGVHDSAAPDLELDLPEGEGFRSLPPLISLAKMVERSRQLRQWFPSGLPTAAERLQAKTAEEFRL